jgi:hypothetical protein
MSFVKITELPLVNDSFTVLVPGLTAGDLMPIVHGPTTFKVELSTLQEYFQLSVEQVAAGETGQVSGYVRLACACRAHPRCAGTSNAEVQELLSLPLLLRNTLLCSFFGV